MTILYKPRDMEPRETTLLFSPEDWDYHIFEDCDAMFSCNMRLYISPHRKATAGVVDFASVYRNSHSAVVNHKAY